MAYRKYGCPDGCSIEKFIYRTRQKQKKKISCKRCVHYKGVKCDIRAILFKDNEDTWCLGCTEYKDKSV